MAARITFERVLRDDDDANGQTVCDWKIEAERYGVKIALKHGTGFLLMRANDVNLFIIDLERAKEAALRLQSETEKA